MNGILIEEELFGDKNTLLERIKRTINFVNRAKNSLKNNERTKDGKVFTKWADIADENFKELIDNAYDIKIIAKKILRKINLREEPYDKYQPEQLQELRKICDKAINSYAEIYKELGLLQYYVDKYNKDNNTNIPSIESEVGVKIQASVIAETKYFDY